MTTMHIHVGGSFADDTKRVLAAVARAENGKQVRPETHIRFPDWTPPSAC